MLFVIHAVAVANVLSAQGPSDPPFLASLSSRPAIIVFPRAGCSLVTTQGRLH